MKDTVIWFASPFLFTRDNLYVNGNQNPGPVLLYSHKLYFPLPLKKLLKNPQASRNSSFLRLSDHLGNRENKSQVPKHDHYLDGKKKHVFYYVTKDDLTFEECSSSNPCHSGYKLGCWSYLKQTNSAYQHQNHIHPLLVIVGIWYVFFAFTVSIFFPFMHHSVLIDLQMLDNPQKL